MSCLDVLQKKYNDKVDVKLEKTAALIENLREVQNERLSLVPSTNMSELPGSGPGERERERGRQLAGEIHDNFVGSAGEVEVPDTFHLICNILVRYVRRLYTVIIMLVMLILVNFRRRKTLLCQR